MWLSHRPASWIGILCLSLIPLIALAKDKPEVPQGYEEAAESDKERPAAKAAVKEEVVKRRVVFARPLAIAGPNVVNLEKQFLPQFKNILKVELAFVRRTCQLDKAHLEPIAKAAEKQLPLVVRQYAVDMDKRRHRGGMRGSQYPSDPRKLLEQQLAIILKDKLKPDQLQQYRQECDKRAASRKRAVVNYIVANMDEKLILTAQQRQKLIVGGLENYQDGWSQSMHYWMSNPQFIPRLSDASVIPVLNKTQKTVWRQTPKQHHGMFWGANFHQGMVIIDD